MATLCSYSFDFFEPKLGNYSVLKGTKQINISTIDPYQKLKSIVVTVQCIMYAIGFLMEGHNTVADPGGSTGGQCPSPSTVNFPSSVIIDQLVLEFYSIFNLFFHKNIPIFAQKFETSSKRSILLPESSSKQPTAAYYEAWFIDLGAWPKFCVCALCALIFVLLPFLNSWIHPCNMQRYLCSYMFMY